MGCSCGTAANKYPAGSSSATANTHGIPAGDTVQVAGSQTARRSVAITNQSAGSVVVGFGAVSVLVDGPGAGYSIDAGATLTVNTTAEVTVYNPQAVTAIVALIMEMD